MSTQLLYYFQFYLDNSELFPLSQKWIALQEKKKAQQNMIIFAVHISKNNVFYLCVEEMKLEAVVRCVFHST